MGRGFKGREGWGKPDSSATGKADAQRENQGGKVKDGEMIWGGGRPGIAWDSDSFFKAGYL